ncbi:Tad domain-containing protein [Sphingomonas sp. LY54]|uniref:pilus assembly protein n=1 Tax=Sphingomonas sp. LY54 TaxID=3095343 RepID=UPI002D78C89E|nr:Tad domain-containing protein [Sphingomonas sp. LY54]WRP30014.1 Tad domain-containing protein [Sphingomonas sp. LY54]
MPVLKMRKRRKTPKRYERGFLQSLLRDTRGNTLVIAAAAMVPMAGMVGGAVDFGRAYLVKTRLQQACDAGVLAARRVMVNNSLDGNPTGSPNPRTEARNFFDINLRGLDDPTTSARETGDYGSTLTTFAIEDVIVDGAPNGTVVGTAQTHVPTTLLRIFNWDEFTLNATCEAQLQISNNDIMFVLDVTGSMNCAAADTTATCSNNGGVEKSNARIKALRTAVVNFYDTINTATAVGSRLRIGFVPYSSNVNVGRLLPSDYIVDNWTYQSREREIAGYSSSTSGPTGWSTTSTNNGSWVFHSFTSGLTNTGCNNSVPSRTTSNGTITSNTTTTTNSSGVITEVTVDQRTATDTEYRRDTSATRCTIQRRTVTRQEQRTTTVTRTPNYRWRYKAVEYPTSQFKLGNAVTTLTGNNYTNVSSTWNGCLEERDTVAQATFSSIPSGAIDLDIDRTPNSIATRWRPSWPTVAYDRAGLADETSTSNRNSLAAVCPKAALNLDVMTQTEVSNYVNAADFRADGSTYHDFGLIWGGRLISPTGIFAARNATAPNARPINRHIIFMTDGDMSASTGVYGLYGYEKLDRRVSGGSINNANLTGRHNERFSAVCETIKGKNITLWVVAYAQTMTTRLQNCASPGRAFYASSDAQLMEQFNAIASQIAELRLTR